MKQLPSPLQCILINNCGKQRYRKMIIDQMYDNLLINSYVYFIIAFPPICGLRSCDLTVAPLPCVVVTAAARPSDIYTHTHAIADRSRWRISVSAMTAEYTHHTMCTMPLICKLNARLRIYRKLAFALNINRLLWRCRLIWFGRAPAAHCDTSYTFISPRQIATKNATTH